MQEEVLKKLLECGTHFGHQTRRWNPKMKRFIFGDRDGIYIIDLEKTIQNLNVAKDFVYDVAMKGGKVLFVGTKKQAQDVIVSEASRAGMPYINNRWMGGLLTNFQTVKKSLIKMLNIEKTIANGGIQNFTKKEIALLTKEKDRLVRDLGGIRDMADLPKAIFVVDSKREEIAVKEANRLGIPLIGLIDTNCDPDVIDYPIPGNDDALKSIRYITAIIADAIIQGRKEFLDASAVRQKDATSAEGQMQPVPGTVEESSAVSGPAESGKEAH